MDENIAPAEEFADSSRFCSVQSALGLQTERVAFQEITNSRTLSATKQDNTKLKIFSPSRFEDIRGLDEVEEWCERTAFITRLTHDDYTKYAKESLNNIISNLPELQCYEKEDWNHFRESRHYDSDVSSVTSGSLNSFSSRVDSLKSSSLSILSDLDRMRLDSDHSVASLSWEDNVRNGIAEDCSVFSIVNSSHLQDEEAMADKGFIDLSQGLEKLQLDTAGASNINDNCLTPEDEIGVVSLLKKLELDEALFGEQELKGQDDHDQLEEKENLVKLDVEILADNDADLGLNLNDQVQLDEEAEQIDGFTEQKLLLESSDSLQVVEDPEITACLQSEDVVESQIKVSGQPECNESMEMDAKTELTLCKSEFEVGLTRNPFELNKKLVATSDSKQQFQYKTLDTGNDSRSTPEEFCSLSLTDLKDQLSDCFDETLNSSVESLNATQILRSEIIPEEKDEETSMVRTGDNSNKKYSVEIQKSVMENNIFVKSSMANDPAMKSSMEKNLAIKSSMANDPAMKSSVEKDPAMKSLVEKDLAMKSSVEKDLAMKSSVEKDPAMKSLKVEKDLAMKSSVETDPAMKSLVEKDLAMKSSVEKDPAMKSLKVEKDLAMKSSVEKDPAMKSLKVEKDLAMKSSVEKDPAMKSLKVEKDLAMKSSVEKDPAMKSLKVEKDLAMKSSVEKDPAMKSLKVEKDLAMKSSVEKDSAMKSLVEKDLAMKSLKVEKDLAMKSSVEKDPAMKSLKVEKDLAMKSSVEKDPAMKSLKVEKDLAMKSSVEKDSAMKSLVEKDLAMKSSMEKDLAMKSSVEKDLAMKSSMEKDLAMKSSVEKDLAMKPAVEKDLAMNSSVEKELAMKSSVEKDLAMKPAVEKDLAMKSSVEKYLAMKPAVEKDLAMKPAVEKDLAMKPAVEKVLAMKSSVEKDFAMKPAVEKDLAMKPAVEKDLAMKPAVEKDLAITSLKKEKVPVQSLLENDIPITDRSSEKVPVASSMKNDLSIILNAACAKIEWNALNAMHNEDNISSYVETESLVEDFSDITNDTFGAEESFLPASMGVAVFGNPEELDELSMHGSKGDRRHNLIRNSLYTKFDPLVAGRQSLAPMLLQQQSFNEDPRRLSTLMLFSPIKAQEAKQKPVSNSKSNSFSASSFVNEPHDNRPLVSFYDESVPVKIYSEEELKVALQAQEQKFQHIVHLAISEAVESHEELLKDEFTKKEMVMQDTLLRRTRHFEEDQKRCWREVEEKDVALAALESEHSALKASVQHFHSLISRTVAKCERMELNYKARLDQLVAQHEDEMHRLKAEHQKEKHLLEQETVQLRLEQHTSETYFIDLVKKFDSLRDICELQLKNEESLQAKIKELEMEKSTKKEEFMKYFQTLQGQFDRSSEEVVKERAEFEQEIQRANMMLSRCESRIQSLSMEKDNQQRVNESQQKEICRINQLLDQAMQQLGPQ